MRRAAARALAGLAAAALLAACSGGGGPARAAGDPRPVQTWHVAPGGRGVSCTAASPCGTINAAYRRASGGDEIRLAAGEYPRQEVGPHRRPLQDEVVVRPGPGEDVVVDGLVVRGERLTFESLTITDNVLTDRDVPARHLVLRAVLVVGGTVYLNNADDARVVDSEIRDGTDIDGINVKDGADRVTIEGTYVHDLRQTGGSAGEHVDCLQAFNVTGLTLRGNRFLRCAHRAVIISTATAGGHVPVRDVTVVDNYFGRCTSGCYNDEVPFQITGSSAAAEDVTITGNTIDGFAFVDPIPGLVFEGNALRRFFNVEPRKLICGTEHERRNTVVETGRCARLSPSDRVLSPADAEALFAQRLVAAGGERGIG